MFRAPGAVRPLLLQGLLLDRPVHAWDSEAMGEGAEGGSRRALQGPQYQMQRPEKGRHWPKVTEQAGIMPGFPFYPDVAERAAAQEQL